MTTLYKRATSRQLLVMRIIEGAVRDAAQAHRGETDIARLARSIAKRATGTLTAEMPDVLAPPREACRQIAKAGQGSIP
jgi:hypothetical protein